MLAGPHIPTLTKFPNQNFRCIVVRQNSAAEPKLKKLPLTTNILSAQRANPKKKACQQHSR